MIITRIRTYRRKDGPKFLAGKFTRCRAGLRYERSALMSRDRAIRFAAAMPGVCLAEPRRFTRAAAPDNYYVRFIRAGKSLPSAAQSLSDIRAQRAADQSIEMDFLPLGESKEFFLCVHHYPAPAPDGDTCAMYETSATECSCPDFENRGRRLGIRCKHSLSLVIHYPALSSRPHPAAPLRTVEERRAWVRANIDLDFC